MKNLSAKSLGTRLILTSVLGLFIISSYFIVSNYKIYTTEAEQEYLNRLHAIARTTALQIDGSQHERIVRKYLGKDDIEKNEQDEDYNQIHAFLSDVQQVNTLSTDIYTLFYDSLNSKSGAERFCFGVTSGNSPYYRHPYSSFPEQLLKYYSVGSKIPSFEDEHGTWLSAFSPIKDEQGRVVGVVEVDQKFDEFLEKATDQARKQLLISLIVVILITGIILFIIRKIVKVETVNKEKLKVAYEQLEKKNKSIEESINYAKQIQTSIIPSEEVLNQQFKSAFMFYQAKDVVSGDFPWMYKKGDDLYIAVVDCTGHGVPGAMMSFIGYFLLNEINSHTEVLEPGKILDKLHSSVVTTLDQDKEGSKSRDGMDIALCKINEKTGTVQYSGAHRPLYSVNPNGELTQYKGTKKSIGGRVVAKKIQKTFETVSFNIKEGEAFYIFSDGLPDQFGGPENLKFGAKRIRKILEENAQTSMNKIKEKFQDSFSNWRGNRPQIDDILMIGIRF